MSGRQIEQVVAVCINADGDLDVVRVWGDGRVLVLWVDESCPGDRVYEHTAREEDADDLRKLIGSSAIGHCGDGRLDDATTQAIRAAIWRREGGRFAPIEEPQP